MAYDFKERELNAMALLYRQGSTLDEIGAVFGCGRHCISKALKKLGEPIRNNDGCPLERHKAKLAEHGRVELIGPYNGRKAKSLYRCLLHGEEHLAAPNHLESGHGLYCCKVAKANETGAELRQRKGLEYQALLDTLGIELLEPYDGAHGFVLHRCRKHGHEQRIQPSRIRGCRKLRCCADEARLKATVDEYDAALAAAGRVQRIAPYEGAHTSILHRCLEHGEEHLASPAQLKPGRGLVCCAKATLEANRVRQRDEFLQRYLKAIEGRLEMLEPYQSSQVPILHRCLIHGFVDRIYPGNAYRGHGMMCCQAAEARKRQLESPTGVHDSLGRYLDDNFFEPDGASEFYLYELRRFPGFIKLGMDSTGGYRPDGEYGKQILSIEVSRIDAWLLEQASLNETRLLAEYPLELEFWSGYTEVRRMDADHLINIATELHEELLELVRWEFALRYVPMTDEHRRRVEQLALEYSA